MFVKCHLLTKVKVFGLLQGLYVLDMSRKCTFRIGLFGLLCLGGATTARAQNVGIGTAAPTTRLHVDGETRVGSTGLSAAAAGAGALRWNGTNLQYSDGTAWVSLGSGTVTAVAASSPLASSGGPTPNISLTGIVPVANGGTGVGTIPANALVVGNGTGAVNTLTPTGTNTVLSWNGSAYTWTDGDGLYIRNQNAVNQTANYRISGSGQINTALGVGVAPGTGGINTFFGGEVVTINTDLLSAGVEIRDHDGDDNGGPYLDFARNNAVDYHARLQLNSTTQMSASNMTNNLLFGINTSTPGFPLHNATNTANWQNLFQNTNAGGSSVYLAHGDGYGAYIDAGTDAAAGTYALHVNRAGAPHLYVRGDGPTGIGGVPAGDVRLDVFDRMRMRSGANGSAGTWFHNGGADRFFLGNFNDNILAVFGAGGAGWFTFFDRVNGRVGIGNSAPARSLDVAGNERIRLGGNMGVANNSQLEISNAGAGSAFISFHNEGSWGAHFGLEPNGWFSTRGWSPSAYDSHNNLRVGELAWGSAGQNVITRDNAGLQGDAGARSGFFETANPTNYYAGAASWQHLIDVRHSNTGNNYAMQIAGSFFDQRFFGRKTNNNPSQAWTEFITTNILNYTGEFCRNQNDGINVAHNSTFSTSQYICFLVQIVGRFEGGGEVVRVGDTDGNGFWDIRINSAQNAVGGCMRCLQIRP
jgi:hypothetical protein